MNVGQFAVLTIDSIDNINELGTLVNNEKFLVEFIDILFQSKDRGYISEEMYYELQSDLGEELARTQLDIKTRLNKPEFKLIQLEEQYPIFDYFFDFGFFQDGLYFVELDLKDLVELAEFLEDDIEHYNIYRKSYNKVLEAIESFTKLNEPENSNVGAYYYSYQPE